MSLLSGVGDRVVMVVAVGAWGLLIRSGEVISSNGRRLSRHGSVPYRRSRRHRNLCLHLVPNNDATTAQGSASVRAAMITALTGPDAVMVREVADPVPNDRQVVVDVEYAGLRFPIFSTPGVSTRCDPRCRSFPGGRRPAS